MLYQVHYKVSGRSGQTMVSAPSALSAEEELKKQLTERFPDEKVTDVKAQEPKRTR